MVAYIKARKAPVPHIKQHVNKNTVNTNTNNNGNNNNNLISRVFFMKILDALNVKWLL